MRPVTVERHATTAVARLHGDLGTPVARRLYGSLRNLAKRRDIERVVVDFADAGRIDSSAVATVTLVEQQLARGHKKLELTNLAEHHRAALDLVSRTVAPPTRVEPPGALERIGDRMYVLRTSARDLVALVADAARQTAAVAAARLRLARRGAPPALARDDKHPWTPPERGPHLPHGAVTEQLSRMGVEAVFIVGLLSFLLGMTTAFQGATQLQRFGAGVFVADMIGVSMVRELAPLITAIILTGRTGAAIAAELGTMKVRSEIDALVAMGISPTRFLVVPRLLAISVVGPALTLMAMFIGILGGMLVAGISLDMPAAAFWARIVDRVDLADFIHGIGKSLVFAWIIGLSGCHLGMRARSDASSVGAATTRTVVTSVFFIIIVDAIFATVSTFLRYR
jgi:phospholipid/cholesterol/gamma-HCH transport system permease protein